MKDLSIEEKAKAYDEAIKRAKKIHNEHRAQCADIMEDIFPELKESEDEQHRKWILEYLYDGLRKSDEQFKKEFKCAIAWFEKQGKKDGRYKYLEELLKADTIYQMAMNDAMVEEAKTKAINALSELEIGKLLGIEKQGEQKPADKIAKFREGDSIQFKGSEHNKYTIKEVCGLSHYINTMGNSMDMSYTDANFEVIKDSDKVEPKFKVKYAGEEYDVLYIKEIAGATFYGIEDESNHIDYVLPENCEIIEQKPQRIVSAEAKEAILSTEWSISDFRTWQYIVSDVLTKKDGIGQYLDSGECKKIAKYMQEEWSKKLSIKQKPAEPLVLTDRQTAIDTLMQTVKVLKARGLYSGLQESLTALAVDLGKSNVVKPAEWSEEDESYLKVAIENCYECGNNYIAQWLKSLRPEPKQEWKPSEEQIATLEYYMTIFAANEYKEVLFGLYEQLKKLTE